jgi:hypothetical protein
MDGKTAAEGTKEVRHCKSWRLKIKPTQPAAETTAQIDVNIMKSFKNFNIEISF